MPTTNYIITSKYSDIKVKVTYVNGLLKKFERQKGKNKNKLNELFSRLYIEELTSNGILLFDNDMSRPDDYYEVIRSESKPRSKYQQYVAAWYRFYVDFVGVKPKFTKADGQNLKQLIKYLNEISTSEDQALEAWNAILSNWKKLDSFHQRNTDIKYINSQINKIINNVREVNNKQSGVSDSYKQRVMDELRTS